MPPAGGVRAEFLRATEARRLPLDPLDDHYLDNVEPGDTDPEPALTSPLVFYGMTEGETLKLVKAPAETVRFEY